MCPIIIGSGSPSNLVMRRDRPSELIDTSTGFPTMLIRVGCSSTADQLKRYKSIVQLWRSGRKYMQGKSHCSLLETVPCAAAIQRKTLKGQNCLERLDNAVPCHKVSWSQRSASVYMRNFPVVQISVCLLPSCVTASDAAPIYLEAAELLFHNNTSGHCSDGNGLFSSGLSSKSLVKTLPKNSKVK